jgi:hypothetical protein
MIPSETLVHGSPQTYPVSNVSVELSPKLIHPNVVLIRTGMQTCDETRRAWLCLHQSCYQPLVVIQHGDLSYNHPGLAMRSAFICSRYIDRLFDHDFCVSKCLRIRIDEASVLYFLLSMISLEVSPLTFITMGLYSTLFQRSCRDPRDRRRQRIPSLLVAHLIGTTMHSRKGAMIEDQGSFGPQENRR